MCTKNLEFEWLKGSSSIGGQVLKWDNMTRLTFPSMHFYRRDDEIVG